jgi:CMP-N,N'-diacetyllegionaminic acid synthase
VKNKRHFLDIKILCIVPARSGSKGIPKKNIKIFDGHPLLGHTIRYAADTGVFDRIVLSTDSLEMAEIGEKYGAEVPFIRPQDLATDTSSMIDVVIHAVESVVESGWVPDMIVLLQPTSPFRNSSDLKSALTLMQRKQSVDSVVSVETVPSHFSPHYVMKIDENGMLENYLQDGVNITRRQDAPIAYSRNGQFYVSRYKTIIEKKSIYGEYCIPFVTSHDAVNLDTMSDWKLAIDKINELKLRNE